MSGKSDQAVTIFAKGFNCAQSVLCACAADKGIDRETLLSIAGAFGGGMGSTGHVCGAVTAAIMVIGLDRRIDPSNDQPKQEGIRLVREFMARFEKLNGSIQCRDLLGYDLTKPDEAKSLRKPSSFLLAARNSCARPWKSSTKFCGKGDSD